jgi:hypothetical protein
MTRGWQRPGAAPLIRCIFSAFGSQGKPFDTLRNVNRPDSRLVVLYANAFVAELSVVLRDKQWFSLMFHYLECGG